MEFSFKHAKVLLRTLREHSCLSKYSCVRGHELDLPTFHAASQGHRPGGLVRTGRELKSGEIRQDGRRETPLRRPAIQFVT